jgi:hypothetical protein
MLMKETAMAYSEVIPKHSPDGSRKMPKILVCLTSLRDVNRERELEIYFYLASFISPFKQ